MAFCRECGSQIIDKATFCTQCGQPVKASDQKEDTEVAPAPVEDFELTQSAEENKPTGDTEGKDAGSPNKKRRNIIIICVVIVLLAAVVAGGFLIKGTLDNEAAHAPRTASLQIKAPDFNAEQDSPIPLQVTGVDLDGQPVDSVHFVDPDEAELELLQGDYHVSVPASPLLSSGDLYAVPKTNIEFTVGEEESFNINEEIVFELIAPEAITDEMLEQAYKYAVESGMCKEAAEKLKQAVAEKRQQALERIAAEEAEQQAAAEEAQREAEREAAEAEAAAQAEAAARQEALFIHAALFDVYLPDSWYGKFKYSTDESGHTVYLTTIDDKPIATIGESPSKTYGSVIFEDVVVGDSYASLYVATIYLNIPYVDETGNSAIKGVTNSRTDLACVVNMGTTPEELAACVVLRPMP